MFVLLCTSFAFASDSTTTMTTIGGYTFTINSSNFGMTHELSVMRHDKHVWSLTEYFLKIMNSDSLGLPEDLNGDRIQDVVIETYSGGAHCCYAQYVVSLGKTFAVTDTIEHAGKWTDRDHDGLWEVTATDLTLDYWKLPHSDSPMPMVILEATDGGFMPSAELMKRDEPTASEVLQMLRDSRDGKAWKDYTTLREDEFVPLSMAVLHLHFVDLIYRGQAQVGLELLETGWPPFIPGREQYTQDVLNMFKKSPYWDALVQLNPALAE